MTGHFEVLCNKIWKIQMTVKLIERIENDFSDLMAEMAALESVCNTKPMKDDPQKISKHLIAEHGSPEAVLKIAIEASAEAQKKEDLYALSVWRDVKRILRKKIEAE